MVLGEINTVWFWVGFFYSLHQGRAITPICFFFPRCLPALPTNMKPRRNMLSLLPYASLSACFMFLGVDELLK